MNSLVYMIKAMNTTVSITDQHKLSSKETLLTYLPRNNKNICYTFIFSMITQIFSPHISKKNATHLNLFNKHIQYTKEKRAWIEMNRKFYHKKSYKCHEPLKRVLMKNEHIKTMRKYYHL